jgi:PIN domain nuclease of toxin-antitoxin system
MKILLDTHILIWHLTNDSQLRNNYELKITNYECNTLIINALYKKLYSLFISHSLVKKKAV